MAFTQTRSGRSNRRDRHERAPAPPIDAKVLDAFALRYVGRYATTTGKLAAYLRRKLRERGGEGVGEIDIERVVARCVAAGYVDDEGFAKQRAATLGQRGFGHRRIAMTLGAAGIEREVVDALVPDEAETVAAAERFARRRRIGRFASEPSDRDEQRRQFGAMIRAGHSGDVARRLVAELPVADRDGQGRE